MMLTNPILETSGVEMSAAGSACDPSAWGGLVSVSDWQRICTVTRLADAVLPLIRTRADLSRWSASNAHGRQMHEAVDILEAAIPTTDSAEV
jgi:hypothetical protein